MVKPPSFDSNGMKKGAWSKEEDQRLRAYVHQFGHSNWRLLPFAAGLARCGKSCRLRWMNYLKPGLKRGKFTQHEEDLVIQLHGQLGNKWSAISAKLPGRTDNEIKNYWHAHIKKRGRRASSSSSSSSSQISSYTTDDSQEEKCKSIDVLNPIADLYSFARAEDDLPSDDDSTHQTCLNADFPPFPEDDQFLDFELFQEMQNASSFFSNSSDGGSPSSAAQFQGNLSSESIGEDMFDMILW